jgi:hypothetical protein
MPAQEIATTTLSEDVNLVAYYRGESTADSKGSNTLTNNGSVAFNASKFGNGFDLGSANSTKNLTRAGNLGLDLSSNWSVSFWVKTTGTPTSTYRFLELQSTVTAARYILVDYNNNAGTRRLQLYPSQGTPVQTNVELGTTDYHHIVVNCAAGGTWTLYLDNVSTLVGARSTDGASDGLAIGGNVANNAVWTSGIIDDMAFFNRVLTVDEIDKLYNGGLTELSAAQAVWFT